MSVIGFHGDPCSRCRAARPDRPARAATHHGMCSMCWLGATERERRAALFDEGPVEPVPPPALSSVAALDAQFALPTREPRQWGEAA